MRPVILVTALGTVTASTIARELKNNIDCYVIGADINKKYEIASSLDVDEFFTFPPISNLDAYLTFVKDFCKNHQVDYYYAVLDKEVVLISNHEAEFEEIGTKLCVVNREFANSCHYKNYFNEWIARNMPAICIKSYNSYEQINENSFPLFIKPVEGLASSGCKKINNMHELRLNVPEDKIGSEILVQDFVEGANITVDLVRNRKTGQMAQAQRHELLRNGNGCGIAVEIIHDEKLHEICNQLMEKLDMNGVTNAEFFAQNGEYKIIEINPRFSAGSRYSCMAGLNTVLNALYISQGKQCVFGEVAKGAHFAERYEAYRMD